MERLNYNEWTVSGSVDYIKVLDITNEFSASVKLMGTSRRKNANSSQRVEFTCLMEQDTYDEAVKKGLDKFKWVTLGGHIETWYKNDGTPKIRFVCDDILEVC
jgi:hypothetical protein